MKRLLLIHLMVGALFVSVGTSCSKKDGPSQDAAEPASDSATAEPAQPKPAAAKDETETTTASKLPGANEVMAALDKKDYDGVVRGLVGMKQAVNTREKELQFGTFVEEVKFKLFDIGDQRALEAARAIRAITGGR